MKWFLASVVLLLVGIYIEKYPEQVTTSQTLNLRSAVIGGPVQPSLPHSGKDVVLKIPSESEADAFAEIESLESLISRYQTMSQDEIHHQIYKTKFIINERNLTDKANTGTITKEERKQLAYLIRANTALHHVLIKQRLEKTKN